MKFSYRTVLLIVFGLMLSGVIVYGFLPQPVPVDVAEVTRETLQVSVEEDGKTRIKERFIVSTPIAGRLSRITLDAGDKVKASATLLSVVEPNVSPLLDPRAKTKAEAAVKAAKAAMKKALANLSLVQSKHSLAKKKLERGTTMLLKSSISKDEYDDMEHAAFMAAAEVKSAEFAVQIAEYELEIAEATLSTIDSLSGSAAADLFRIYSPITGQVLRVFHENAAAIDVGKQLLELGNPSDLEVVIDVLTTDAVQINPGAKVVLEHWGGPYPLLGRVRLVEPAAFLKISALGVEEQRVNVIVDLVDPPEKRNNLGDAYRVEARIIIWEGEKVLQLPAGALFRHGEQWAVFRVLHGRARLQVVETGRSNGLQTQILSGLKVGDTVVVHPSDKVRDGVSVTVR